MKIARRRWATNPKTPEGWPKRVAIALLGGLGLFLLSLPVSMLLFYQHYRRLYPNDPQNLLSALTAAVLLGLVLAGVGFAGLLGIFFLLSLRGKGAKPLMP